MAGADDKQHMPFDTNLNLFLFFSFVVVIPIVLLSMKATHRTPFRRLALNAFLGIEGGLICAGVMLEHYRSLSCPVAPGLFHEMTTIFEQNICFLAASSWARRAFIAEGTLLAVARQQSTLNVWEHHSSIFIAVDANSTEEMTSLLYGVTNKH